MQAPQTSGAMQQTLRQADLVLLVVNVIDFEGTFCKRLAMQCGPRLMIVANKCDLLPARTVHAEVLAWLGERLQEADVAHCGLFLVSAKKGIGTAALWSAVREQLNGRGSVVLAGTPQVGKSSLLKSWSETSSKSDGRKRRSRRRSRKAAGREAATVDA
jgi:ribosome biogenesis GTPase A